MDEKNKLSYNEIEEFFEEIKSGQKYIKCFDRVILFKYPTEEQLLYAKRLERVLSLQFKDKIPNIEDINSILLKKPVVDIKILRQEESKLLKVLDSPDITSNKKSHAFYRDKLQEVKEQISEVSSVELRKKSMETYNFDRRVKQLVYTYFITCCTYIVIGQKNIPLFGTKDQKILFFWYRKLIEPFLEFYYGPLDIITRQLARNPKISSLWKISCSTGSPFFNGNVTNYTPIQTKLCFWLGYYSDVFKNLGSPDSDRLVDDDVLFDKWVQDKIKELKNPKSDSSNSSTGGKGGTATNKHKIVFKNPTHASSARSK